MNGIFSLNWKNVLSATIFSVIVSLLMYVLNLGDIYLVKLHEAINIVVITFCSSLLKAMVTDNDGKLLGVIPMR
jgi:multisubunit Na+/H+ antiporter MnhE subunit